MSACRIRDGGLVAFPTETVYGLGADALNAEAVARIFEVKNRPSFDPLIVHVEGWDQAKTLVMDPPPLAARLAEAFWPGPLTLVLSKASCIPDIVTAGLPTVAVRMPNHPVALELIRAAKRPIAAPSANRFGEISPTTAEHVRDQLGEGDLMILDGGPCSVGVESSIVSLAGDTPVLLRYGGTPVEDIERITGPLVIAVDRKDMPQAPGMLERHYAPRTPVAWATKDNADSDSPGRADPDKSGSPRPDPSGPALTKRKVLLAFKPPAPAGDYEHVEYLSESGDLREAASRLFSLMRKLDRFGADVITVERVPDEGLGKAINDRLKRACAG